MILNRISPSIYPRLKAMIEEQTGLLVYGYLPEKKELQVESRYLGLRLPGEMETMKETLKRLGSLAEETIDLAGLLSLAENSGMMEEEERRTSEGCGETDGKVPAKEKVRIGIAKDEAFCFFYQDNLKILEDMGAELVYFPRFGMKRFRQTWTDSSFTAATRSCMLKSLVGTALCETAFAWQ